MVAAFAAPLVEFKHFVVALYLITSVAIDLSITMQKSIATASIEQPYAFNPVVAVLMTEVIKLGVSVTWFALSPRTEPPVLLSRRDLAWLALPAAIFTLNNVLVWWAIGKNDVAVFGVFRDTMILRTAVLWCLVYQVALGRKRLASIAVVFAGLVLNR